MQTYESFEGEGFTYAIIHLSISLAHLESSNPREARKGFERAEEIYSKGMRIFGYQLLQLGVGSLFREYSY